MRFNSRPIKGQPRVGTIYRYNTGSTALLKLTTVERNGRVYGDQCMGGITGANVEDLSPVTEEDLDTWDCVARRYHLRQYAPLLCKVQRELDRLAEYNTKAPDGQRQRLLDALTKIIMY